MKKQRQFEHELSGLIGRHSAWLDGPSWSEITQRVGSGYFVDDAPELLDPQAFVDALADVFGRDAAWAPRE